MTPTGPTNRRWSLSTHLTWVVLFALLPALAIQYASNLERRQEAKVRAQEHLLQLVNDLTHQQEQVTSSALEMLTTLSFFPELRRGDGPAFGRILRALQREDPRFVNLLALDPSGNLLASAVPTTNLVMKDRKYFWEAVETRRFTVGEYVLGRTTGTPVIHFSLPVMNERGDLLAVLAVSYDLTRYGDLFNRSELPAETSLVVLDHAGTVLYHLTHIAQRYGTLVGTRLPKDQADRVMGGGPEGTYWDKRRDGQRALFAYRQVRTPGQTRPYLYIQVGRPESQVLGESLRTDRRNMILLLVTGALALLAARAMGTRVIATPIRQLVQASRHIGRGDLYHRPELRTASREVAQLGEELGRTSLALAQREEEQRRTQEALLNSQRLESLGVLAGGIAHDFNNLLAAVQGNLNLAQAQIDPGGPAHRPLEQAEMAVQKASDLTRQMLAYSGRGHFLIKPLDLNLSVKEMSHLLQVTLPKKTTLILNLAPDVPPILADAAQIQQVMLNLVTNAAEAIGPQEGVITLSTSAEYLDQPALEALCPTQGLEAGSFAILQVADTGCGMDSELIERIFDPFFTTKQTGHGLGLSAIHGILKTHRAGIHIKSSPGNGTLFRILFPATQELLPQLLREDSGPRRMFQGLALMADDEPMVLDFAVSALESMGFEVISARDGAEAVARFAEAGSQVRLALLDLTMPRMDGLEAFHEMRQAHPALPVILSSGYDADAAAQRLVELGQVRFLPKPYPMRELRKAVLEVMADAEGITTPEPPNPEA
ncbi:response regulator [Geothrix sp. PMB-07]|uniref:response regulator n=1 Tax=Geothrix sp. PMB-07 TaxID=3068640 RepID=UPI0027409383|nr:response regulator [Geothrix sp. PMB-07]WLT32514.1 response regulator [Geothrix sp. PMB-07]